MPYITHYGTKDQQEKYIPRMTSGECVASIAMTEPDAGSDLQGIRTNARKDGDDWIINGSKIYITNGWLTDTCIVVTKTGAEKRAAHGVSLFLVDADTPGFHKGRKLQKLGLKSQDTAELFFEDVRVPGSALLGRENAGFYQLMEQLPQERLMIGVHSVATCEAVFEATRDWVRQRKAFGRREDEHCCGKSLHRPVHGTPSGGQMRERACVDGKVLDDGAGEQGGRGLPAAARRLGLHVGDADCQGLC